MLTSSQFSRTKTETRAVMKLRLLRTFTWSITTSGSHWFVMHYKRPSYPLPMTRCFAFLRQCWVTTTTIYCTTLVTTISTSWLRFWSWTVFLITTIPRRKCFQSFTTFLGRPNSASRCKQTTISLFIKYSICLSRCNHTLKVHTSLEAGFLMHLRRESIWVLYLNPRSFRQS